MYIISLKHTRKQDKYITLWRSNNAGYTWLLREAGFYPKPEKGYHDSETDMPISYELAEKVWEPTYDSNRVVTVAIPNNPDVHKKLKIKMTRNGLVKLTHLSTTGNKK